ncbi:hypothetical protein [Nitrosovibrio sp. Nv6]|uniref:hypothetical protein n=1 Tax=Nitrosovibrio sp. Nv6 TaxID=1855340 RepID=UPI0008AFA46E|nr:hypothetical protein [Nitrosovibrio sp. Nv6]SEO79755.1 hypothetical protein SAMN05216316_1128 [Nitrosovibrio sp. Nv6]
MALTKSSEILAQADLRQVIALLAVEQSRGDKGLPRPAAFRSSGYKSLTAIFESDVMWESEQRLQLKLLEDYLRIFYGAGNMKKLYRNMSDLNPAEFDNWVETTTTKIFKHTKMNKNKFWGDTDNNRDRNKKKRDVRPYS